MTTKGSILGLLILLGSMVGWAEPVRQADLNAASPWAAHLDVAKLQDSPLGAFLLKTAGFDRVLELENAMKEQLSLDLNAIESVTLFGSGEQGRETAILLRGKFGEMDLSALPIAKDAPAHHGIRIHEGPRWQQSSFFLARRSETELVTGTSLPAVRESLDLLAGRQKSWEGIALPDHASEELASATALLALDMARLGSELKFEADFTRSARRAWLLIGSRDEQVEVTVLVDSTDAEGLAYLRSQLGVLTMMLASGQDVPPARLELVKALRIETKENWMTVKISAPPEKAAEFLQSLEPLFREAPAQPISSE